MADTRISSFSALSEPTGPDVLSQAVLDDDTVDPPAPAPHTNVERGLQTRHLTMIAIGGSIGTGLFMACGIAISSSGPGGALVAFALIGVLVYFLIAGLGEIATYCPVSGSFSTFSEKFVDPALGFTSGWNFCINSSFSIAVECMTIGLLVEFWLPSVPPWIWGLIAYVIIFLANAFTVKSYGEVEYWMAIIKVASILIFIVIGFLRMFGAIGDATFFEYFTYAGGPFIGGFNGFLSALVIAGYSFQGVEAIGLTAAETADPEISFPKAIRQVFWRILIFYIFTIFIFCVLIKYDDPALLGSDSDDVSESPFTIVLQRAGIPVAVDIMNAVVLSSVLSSANSIMYTSSRMLYSLSLNGQAPGIFSRTIASGIPLWALLATAGLGLVLFVWGIFQSQIYTILINATSLAGFLSWITIAIAHFRFRMGYVKVGKRVEDLKYYARLFPIGPIVVIVACVFFLFCQDLESFRKRDWLKIGLTYFTAVVFVVMYVVYKVVKKTVIVTYAVMFPPDRVMSTEGGYSLIG
jgi:lysine-specific permease